MSAASATTTRANPGRSSTGDHDRRQPRVLTVTGWVITALVMVFLGQDTILHVVNPTFVRTVTVDLGFDTGDAVVFGVLSGIGLLLHLIPRTSLLGAIWLSAYLGGAVCANFRADQPLASHILFPVYVGLFLWFGFWLRRPEVRRLLPVRR